MTISNEPSPDRTVPKVRPMRTAHEVGRRRDEKQNLPPAADRGQTIIDDEVVGVIGRIAAEQVAGIHRIGDSTLRGMLGRFGRTGGVDAEVGMREAAVDVEIVVEFGYPIRDVVAALREAIIDTIETMAGRRVVEVNVYVVDVHVPTTTHKRRRNVE